MNTGPSGFGSFAFSDDEENISLDLYKPVIREVSLQNGRLIPIYPISMTSSSGPFEFSLPDIPGQVSFQLAHTSLCVNNLILNFSIFIFQALDFLWREK